MSDPEPPIDAHKVPFCRGIGNVPFKRISDVEKALIERIAPKPEDDKR